MTYCYFPTTAETTDSWKLQWTGGTVVANGTYWFSISTPYGGTILSMDYATSGSTSFVANVKIAGASVTSLSAITVNSATVANTLATGANVFTAGQVITVAITSATGSPTNAILNLRFAKAMGITAAPGPTVVVFNTPGAGTWSVPRPAGTSILVETWGGGSGGSGTGSTNGGGGGGGAYASSNYIIDPNDVISGIAYSIGGGGAGGAGRRIGWG